MVKKLLALSSITALSTSLLFSATDKQIVDFIVKQGAPANLIKVEKREKVKDSEIEVVKLSVGKQDIFIFTHKDYIFQDIINVSDGQSYMNNLRMAQMEEIKKDLRKILKTEKDDNFVKIGDPKKPLVTMFTDPECPFCREKLKTIEKTLETNSIKLIFTPVHKKPSLQKSVLIYKQTKDLKTDVDKIKVLRKYFDENATVDGKVSDEEVKVIEDLRKKYFSLGLRGVPLIVED